ncbi:TonB-dependent siderophore receptor [Undibacterium sp. Ren11W]|uniref:TonB-dependent siderophore receptor n=1 Tax=Undibacterium sp. Ren11W TaxID=3413045 RepID=UPI003BF1F0CF
MSKKNHRHSALTLAIAQVLVFAPSAYAQSREQSLQEVVITGNKEIDSQVRLSKAGGFIEVPLLETPASVAVFTQAQIQDLRIRQTSDAMKFDASVNDAYNAVGYAEQFSIRGFALDNASSYRKDGFAIPGDASIPLENKERIEVLKGIAGFQAGFATPGGILNYLTKRPSAAPVRSATLEVSERGTTYGSIDLGGRSDDTRFGYRINAAGERMRSYIKGADGERQFVSAAFDWHISPQALLQLDLDYQHKSQLSAPGFQLFNGTDLPSGIKADMMLNDQPWAKPVDTRNSNLGLRFEYQINSDWTASIAANKHEFKRDDYTAFPSGCGILVAGYCANGDYYVFDYQSVNESKSLLATQAQLNGKFSTGGVRHEFATGVSSSQRRDYFGDYVYEKVGTSNIFHPVVIPQSNGTTRSVALRRTDKEWSAFAQDIISLSNTVKLHLGLRHQHISRADYDNSHLLPNAALVIKPAGNWSIYTAYSQGLENGGIASKNTSNENVMLSPAKSRQLEIGTKAELSRDLSVSAAIFRINKPLEYINANNLYVSNGDAIHTGLELSAQGKLSPQLSMGASITAIDARQKNTGDPLLEDKRVTNVPNLKSTVYLDYALQQVKGLHLNTSWQHAASKAFSPDNKISVPGYDVLNFGARYTVPVAGVVTTIRLNVDNALDKFYWRDVTQSSGGYLFPGAPRTYKLSAQFDY